jgi:hypothetical protein
MPLHRRARDKGDRASRLTAAGFVGLPVSLATAAVFRRIGIELGVEEAMVAGTIIGVVVVCFHDTVMYVGAYIKHKLNFNPPKE